MTSRRPVGPVEKNPRGRRERPDGPVVTGLTPHELAFRELIAGIKDARGRVELNPSYALWCRATRANWEQATLEFQHPDGTWRSERPDDDVAMPLLWRRKDEPDIHRCVV